MPECREYRIAATDVKSLCWLDRRLVDWVGGGRVYSLDAGVQRTKHGDFAYRFDSALISPSCRFAVIYERLGTKGVLLEHGQIVREINRPYYYAHAYEYPVAFVRLGDGRELLAHCPDRYHRIDMEDI